MSIRHHHQGGMTGNYFLLLLKADVGGAAEVSTSWLCVENLTTMYINRMKNKITYGLIYFVVTLNDL